jgi:prepilin signal peptidase PulO-like enzyme (type II secretory pathway)
MLMSSVMISSVTATLLAVLIATPLANWLGMVGLQPWLTPQEVRDVSRLTPRLWAVSAALSLAFGALLAWLWPHALGQISIIPIALASGVLLALLLTLARIDHAHRLLPDSLTLALALSGFAFHGLFNPWGLMNSLIGAVAGYAVLWAFTRTYESFRKVKAMGRGDFAMTAGIGAWVGWPLLPLALTVACLVGLMVVMIQRKTWSSEGLAFGPALACGALAAWVQIV